MLDLARTVAYFDEHFTRSAFRLELLDRYDVESDGDEFRRYLAGDQPKQGFKDQWLEVLRSEREAGKLRHRVHILRTPLTDYLRYECEWGYRPNAEAGEEISILDTTETRCPDGIPGNEFWLLDDEHVLLMMYDLGGVFLGAELADDPEPYRQGRDRALAAAEEFGAWWTRHPDEWRANRAA